MNQIIGIEDPHGDAEKISEIIKTRLTPISGIKEMSNLRYVGSGFSGHWKIDIDKKLKNS